MQVEIQTSITFEKKKKNEDDDEDDEIIGIPSEEIFII